jgi:hypothetical protein
VAVRDAPERRALIELREPIRDVLAAHNSGQPDPAAASRLAMALACSRLTVTVDPSGDVQLVGADHDPFTRIIGTIAAVNAEAAATVSGTASRAVPGT